MFSRKWWSRNGPQEATPPASWSGSRWTCRAWRRRNTLVPILGCLFRCYTKTAKMPNATYASNQSCTEWKIYDKKGKWVKGHSTIVTREWSMNIRGDVNFNVWIVADVCTNKTLDECAPNQLGGQRLESRCFDGISIQDMWLYVCVYLKVAYHRFVWYR